MENCKKMQHFQPRKLNSGHGANNKISRYLDSIVFAWPLIGTFHIHFLFFGKGKSKTK